MNKFIRKNQKKLLAIFGIFLMISFVATTGVASRSTGSGADESVGTLRDGKTSLTRGDYANYRNQWQLLKQQFLPTQLAAALGGLGTLDDAYLVKTMADLQTSMAIQQKLSRQPPQIIAMIRQNPQRWLPLVLGGNPEEVEVAQAVMAGEMVYGQFELHETLFPLLAKEAEMLGIGANGDRIKDLLTAMSKTPDKDREEYDALSRALRTLFMVAGGGDLAARVAKSSPVEGAHVLAMQNQQLSLNLVEFTSGEFLKDTREPSEFQLKEQFDKFKTVVADRPGAVGYKFPNRLKYEAIEVKRAEVEKGIAKVARDEAREYYLLHKDEGRFIATSQPAAPTPAQNMSLNPVTPGATTRQKSFEEVEADVVTTLKDIRVLKLKDEVRDLALNTMRADYDAYKAATGAATKPTTAPVSSLGVPYDSKEYLGKLRDKIRAELHVEVAVEREEGLQTPTTLAESRLGKAGYSVPERDVTFSALLTTRVAPFLSDAERALPGAGAKPLAVWEPTPAMTDLAAGVLIARVTAADPAHVPASVGEVKEQVTADLRNVEALKLAKAAADAAAAEAVRENKWLQAIANEKGKSVIKTGLFSPNQGSVPGYEIKRESNGAFAQGVVNLLSLPERSGEAPRPLAVATRPAATQPAATTAPATQQAAATKGAATKSAAATTKTAGASTRPATLAVATTRPSGNAPTPPPATTAATQTAAAATKPATTTTAKAGAAIAFKGHPVGVIELPLEAKVVVAEVDQLKAMWTRDVAGLREADAARQSQSLLASRLRMQWFDYDEATERMNYVPANGRRDERGNGNPRQNKPLAPLEME